MVTFDFSGKTIIVTGALGSIGGAIARLFLQSGAYVVLSDRREQTPSLLEPFHPWAGRYIFQTCDTTSLPQCEAMCALAIAQTGAIDVLVNNAGGSGPAANRTTIDHYDSDIWAQVLNMNLLGTYHCARAATPYMVAARGGRVINIGSVVGAVPQRNQSPYAAAKAGIHQLTRAMALELAEHNILVNAVAPGTVYNDNTRAVFYTKKDVYERFMRHIPLHRPGNPEEIALPVAFLADEVSSYVTGQVLIVDGGWSCGYSRDF